MIRPFPALRQLLVLLGVALALLAVAPMSANAQESPSPDTHACGIKQLPVPDYITGYYNFRASCRAHDVCYRSMSEGRRYARLWCDRRFKRSMLRHCETASRRPIRCKIAATTYYVGVRGPLGIWAYDVLTPQVVERTLS